MEHLSGWTVKNLFMSTTVEGKYLHIKIKRNVHIIIHVCMYIYIYAQCLFTLLLYYIYLWL